MHSIECPVSSCYNYEAVVTDQRSAILSADFSCDRKAETLLPPACNTLGNSPSSDAEGHLLVERRIHQYQHQPAVGIDDCVVTSQGLTSRL